MRIKSFARPLAALALGCGMLLLLMPESAAAAPAKTKKVVVTRAPDDPHKILISWLPVTGAHHYNVSVFDGKTDTVKIVPAAENTFSLSRDETCLRLRVNIGWRATRGAGGTSSNVWLNTLAPGGVSGLRAERDPDGSTVVATWKPPTWGGWGAPAGYHVQLIQSGDKKVVFDGVSNDPTARFTGLDRARNYTVAVAAQNTFGSCATAKLAVGSSTPGPAGSLKAVRDPANPSRVNVKWAVPSYTGYGKITHYVVSYGIGKATTSIRVDDGTATVLDIDQESDWVVQVQAFNDSGAGRIAGPVKVARVGAQTGIPAVKPGITITQEGAQIAVRLTGPIGAYTEYPKLAVRLRSLVENGFNDEQWGQNGAQLILFGDVPAGVYSVGVSGANDKAEVEWGYRTVNIGDVGLLAASNWRLASGKADVGVDAVSMENKTEARVISTVSRTDADLVLMSTITLKEGRGYGVTVRASTDADPKPETDSKGNDSKSSNDSKSGSDANGKAEDGKKLSGYLFEYDPGYSKIVPGYGPALVLRLQYRDSACSTPMALTKMPDSIASAGAHRLAIVVKGDTFYATIDDVVVFDLASLSTAESSVPCKMPTPTGTQVGLSNWGSGADASVVFAHTTLN
jgi:hypothetical protein